MNIDSTCIRLLFSLQLEKGKFHGSMDTGLSVIVYKRKGRRIDVDADDLIYHLKVHRSQRQMNINERYTNEQIDL